MHTFNINFSNFTNPIVDGLNHVLALLPSLILVVLVGVLVIRVAARTLRFVLALTTMQAGLRDVLISIVEIVLWMFLAIRVLEMLGFSNIIVFFTGSIAAFGIAMAAGGSTLVADITAGIFLARDVDFDVGDEVVAGETPTQGVVESMDARRTRIRDKDGILHVIPNSVVERREWVLVRRRQDVTALARAVTTAKRLRRVAKATRAVVAEQRGVTPERQVRLREGDQ